MLKEITNTFTSYRTTIQMLIRSYSHIWFDHVSRAHNIYMDALVTLASKIGIHDETVDVRIIKTTLGATATDLIPTSPFDEQDW